MSADVPRVRRAYPPVRCRESRPTRRVPNGPRPGRGSVSTRSAHHHCSTRPALPSSEYRPASRRTQVVKHSADPCRAFKPRLRLSAPEGVQASGCARFFLRKPNYSARIRRAPAASPMRCVDVVVSAGSVRRGWPHRWRARAVKTLALLKGNALVLRARSLMELVEKARREVAPFDSEPRDLPALLDRAPRGRTDAGRSSTTASAGLSAQRSRGNSKPSRRSQSLKHPTWQLGPRSPSTRPRCDQEASKSSRTRWLVVWPRIRST